MNMFSLAKKVAVFVPLLLSLVGIVSASDATDDPVLVLSGDTIEQAIKDHSHLVVEFYAPWCGHCKKLAPTLSEAATKMKEIDKDVVFAKMDCTAAENKAFKNQMGIKGFPSFRMFEGSLESAKEHKPPRSMPHLADYFKAIKDGVEPPKPPPAPKKAPSPPLIEPEDSQVTVLTKKTFEAFIEEHEFAVVEFYAPWCGHCKKLFPEYTKASIELKDHDPPIKFAKIDVNEEANKVVGKKFGVKGFPSLRIFHKAKAKAYEGPRHADGIVEYLKGQIAELSGISSKAEKGADDEDTPATVDDKDDKGPPQEEEHGEL